MIWVWKILISVDFLHFLVILKILYTIFGFLPLRSPYWIVNGSTGKLAHSYLKIKLNTIVQTIWTRWIFNHPKYLTMGIFPPQSSSNIPTVVSINKFIIMKYSLVCCVLHLSPERLINRKKPHTYAVKSNPNSSEVEHVRVAFCA